MLRSELVAFSVAAVQVWLIASLAGCGLCGEAGRRDGYRMGPHLPSKKHDGGVCDEVLFVWCVACRLRDTTYDTVPNRIRIVCVCMDECVMCGVLCSVAWWDVLLPFSVLRVSFWLFVSLFVSRFRWDCTAGCSEHSREAPNTFGFWIAAGCSEHSRELPTLSGSVAAGCSEHSRELPTLTGSVAAATAQ